MQHEYDIRVGKKRVQYDSRPWFLYNMRFACELYRENQEPFEFRDYVDHLIEARSVEEAEAAARTELQKQGFTLQELIDFKEIEA